MNPRNVYKIKQSFLMQDNNKWESGTEYNRHTALSLKRYASSFCGSDKNQHHTSTSHVKQFSTNGKNAVVMISGVIGVECTLQQESYF